MWIKVDEISNHLGQATIERNNQTNKFRVLALTDSLHGRSYVDEPAARKDPVWKQLKRAQYD